MSPHPPQDNYSISVTPTEGIMDPDIELAAATDTNCTVFLRAQARPAKRPRIAAHHPLRTTELMLQGRIWRACTNTTTESLAN